MTIKKIKTYLVRHSVTCLKTFDENIFYRFYLGKNAAKRSIGELKIREIDSGGRVNNINLFRLNSYVDVKSMKVIVPSLKNADISACFMDYDYDNHNKKI